MDIQGYAGGSSTKGRLKQLKKSTSVTYSDKMYNLSFEDLSKKIEEIDGELTLLKKYSGKIVDKYQDLDCFIFDRDLIAANYEDLSDNKKIERGLLYLLALEVKNNTPGNNTPKGESGYDEDEDEMYGGVKTRFSKSGDIKTFLQRMAKVTKGKSIFTNKQRKRLEYELAKFIKGEKSSNLTQKDTDIANIERLFLTQFRDWYDSNLDKLPIIFQKSFSSVFTDINSLKLKESKSDELEKILGKLVKKDDKTGFYSFIKRKGDDTKQTGPDTEQTLTSLEQLNITIKDKTQELEDNKRTIANANRFISENANNRDAAEEIKSKSTEREQKESSNIQLTKDINEATQKAEKIQKDANEELASIKEEYKKALGKIEEKYRDKKDEKVKDTVTKTPLNLAKKDDVENDIDTIFVEKIDEFSVKLDPKVKDELNEALHKVIVGEFSGGQVGGMITTGRPRVMDKEVDTDIETVEHRVMNEEVVTNKSTQPTEGQNQLTFNGKKLDGTELFSVNDVNNKIKEIREGYSSITGDKPSLQKIIEILNENIVPKYVINDGLRIFVYSHFIREFAKEIKKRQEEVDKYMEYAEGKFGDDQLSTLRVKFGLRKRIVEAGLKELLQGILTVTYREYQEKYLLQLKQALPGVDKLMTVKDENIRKLLYSLETNKRLKDEIISVNKELEPTLMEFIKLLKKEEEDEKALKEEEKKKKEEEKKRKAEEEKKRKEERKRKKEEERKRKEEEKKNKLKKDKSKKDKPTKDGKVNTKSEKRKGDDKGLDSGKGVDSDKGPDSDKVVDSDKGTDSDKGVDSSEMTDSNKGTDSDNLEVFKDSSVLELEPSDVAIGLTEQGYSPDSTVQNRLSKKIRESEKLKERLKEERRSKSIKETKLKKQLKELMDLKYEDKETEKHILMERFKLIQELKKAINKNHNEKKRIEEEHRIAELKLLQAKKSLEKDNELLAKENIRLKNQLQIRGKLNKDKPHAKTVKKKIKGKKANKSKRKRGKLTT